MWTIDYCKAIQLLLSDSTLSTLVVLVCYRPDCASTLFHRQIHRVSEKKRDTGLLDITSANVIRFSKSFKMAPLELVLHKIGNKNK